MPDAKRCSRCDTIQQPDAFHRNRSRRDGLASWCRSCNAERAASYRAANLEACDARAAAWKAAHQDQVRASDRARGAARYAANPERLRAWGKEWLEADPERARSMKRASRQRNLDAARESHANWKRHNPEKVRAASHRRRARKLAAFVEDVLLSVLVERDHDRCGICGKRVLPAARSVDHILPLSRGGEHSYANTQLAHLRCNNRRNNHGPAQLRLTA